MIHEPQTNITCDYDGCSTETYIEGVLRSSTVEDFLKSEGWTVIDGKHYCDWHEDGKEA